MVQFAKRYLKQDITKSQYRFVAVNKLPRWPLESDSVILFGYLIIPPIIDSSSACSDSSRNFMGLIRKNLPKNYGHLSFLIPALCLC